ncbi:MAG: ATP-binding cassette domain-containing protein, partial [Lachnospiraceae bacterium]|nr:ATP-binding cassette domain-containing protein [Lachnospiraceae bacterium]
MKDYENAVQLNDVCKERFGVLKNVSFCVPKGTIAALIGANGAGKTTILRVLTGIAAWNEGEIRLF